MWSRYSLQVFVLMVALTALTNSACNRNNNDVASKAEQPRILLLLNTYNNEFFRKIEEGFQSGMTPEQKKNYHLDVRYCTTPGDVSYQRRELDRYIADYVSGRTDPLLKAVIIAPAGSNDEITAEIKQLRDNHVPVVIVDLRIKAEALARAHTDYDAYIGSRNRDGGVLAATQIANHLPKGGTILILNGVPGMEATIDRRQGFLDRIVEINKQNHVTFKIIERTANFLRSDGQSTVDGLLSMGQQPDGIFAANDEMALGSLEALRQEQSKRKTIVVGFDATQEAVAAVNKGLLSATIAQDPVGIGQRAAAIVDLILKHKPIVKEQLLSPKVVAHE